jgi:hypothetical protein
MTVTAAPADLSRISPREAVTVNSSRSVAACAGEPGPVITTTRTASVSAVRAAGVEPPSRKREIRKREIGKRERSEERDLEERDLEKRDPGKQDLEKEEIDKTGIGQNEGDSLIDVSPALHPSTNE